MKPIAMLPEEWGRIIELLKLAVPADHRYQGWPAEVALIEKLERKLGPDLRQAIGDCKNKKPQP